MPDAPTALQSKPPVSIEAIRRLGLGAAVLFGLALVALAYVFMMAPLSCGTTALAASFSCRILQVIAYVSFAVLPMSAIGAIVAAVLFLRSPRTRA